MSQPAWLEISLTVDGELAEPVAEVLRRYIPDGVVIESTAVAAADDDSEGHAVGPLRVSGYLLVDDQLEEKRRSLEEALWFLGRIRPLPEPEFRPIQQQDWSAAWKQHYQPVAIGRRLAIIPAWLESPWSGRAAVRIDPGMAFGTGTHPTTQLCLEIIESIFEEPRIETRKVSKTWGSEARWLGKSQFSEPRVIDLDVIDVGCGSGILSIAALKLGARQALCVDIDADAVRATQANAEANGVAGQIETGLGSLAEILQGAFSLRRAGLVLANILAPALERLLDEGLGELLAPGGSLVLSGILDVQAAGVEAALARNGLALSERRQMGDWVALKAS